MWDIGWAIVVGFGGKSGGGEVGEMWVVFSLIFSYFYLRSGIPSPYVAQILQLRGTSPQSRHVVMDGWMG